MLAHPNEERESERKKLICNFSCSSLGVSEREIVKDFNPR